MISIRKRGNVYQYYFEAGKVNGKKREISNFNSNFEFYQGTEGGTSTDH